MAKNYFNRYVWLLNTIQSNGYVTLEKISELWQESPLNEDGSPLAERTFHNHKEAIKETFGIDIKYDKSRGYFLSDSTFSHKQNNESVYQWLLAALSVNNIIREADAVCPRNETSTRPLPVPNTRTGRFSATTMPSVKSGESSIALPATDSPTARQNAIISFFIFYPIALCALCGCVQGNPTAESRRKKSGRLCGISC